MGTDVIKYVDIIASLRALAPFCECIGFTDGEERLIYLKYLVPTGAMEVSIDYDMFKTYCKHLEQHLHRHKIPSFKLFSPPEYGPVHSQTVEITFNSSTTNYLLEHFDFVNHHKALSNGD